MNKKLFILFILAAAIGAGLPARAADAPAAQPNILFCIADDASWKHFSAYGCKFCKTPNFDRVAREGVLFANCFTPLPKCSPSRASALTGRYPWQNEEACDQAAIFPSADRLKVYPDLLEAAGYAIAFSGKGWAPGDWERGGRPHNPAGPEMNELKTKPPTKGITSINYAANFAAFLKRKPRDKPFCFWYGGHEPHRPYEEGSGLKSGMKLEDVEVPPYLPDDKIVRSDLLDYVLEIQWFDTHLGRMLKILEERGELDNTFVVVTSDNGLPFPRAKGHIYEDACHMPLAIRWGGRAKGGRVVEDFISFVDYAPTIMEAAGLAPPKEMSGRSLMNILTSAKSGQIEPQRDHVIVGRERNDASRANNLGYPVRGIRTKDFFYTRNFEPDRWPSGDPEKGYGDIDASPSKTDVISLKEAGETRWYDLSMAKRGSEELYSLQTDPSGVENVAGNTDYEAVRQKLWDQLQKELKEQQDPRILGKGDVFDRYERAKGKRNETVK